MTMHSYPPNAVHAIGLTRTLAAEYATWKRSAVAWLPWAGLAFGLVNTLLFVAASTDKSWNGLFGYQNLWVVFVGPLLTALLAASLTQVDRDARGGGTWYRPVNPRDRRVSRFAVLAARSLQLNLLAIATPVVIAAMLSTLDQVPVDRLAEAIILSWMSQLGMLAMLSRIGEYGGRLVVLAAGLVWTVSGAVLSESRYWMLLPFTWVNRGLLPVIGTHANGISLEPGAALAAMSPLPVAMLGALWALPFVLIPHIGWTTRAAAVDRHLPLHPAVCGVRPEMTLAPTGDLHRSRPHVVAAVLWMLARTSIWWLSALAIALSALFLRWRDPDDCIELYTLLIVPNGTLVLAILLWRAASDGWRAVAARPTGTTGPALALTGVGIAVTSMVSLIVIAIYLAAGLPFGHAWPMTLTTVVAGSMLTTFLLWLTMRTSVAVAVAVGVVGGLLAALIGGTSMQNLLWPFIPWSWARYLESDRMVVTVPLSIALTALFAILITRAARKEAGTSSIGQE